MTFSIGQNQLFIKKEMSIELEVKTTEIEFWSLDFNCRKLITQCYINRRWGAWLKFELSGVLSSIIGI